MGWCVECDMEIADGFMREHREEAHVCRECGLPLPGPHRGTCSMSLMSGGPGYGQVGGNEHE